MQLPGSSGSLISRASGQRQQTVALPCCERGVANILGVANTSTYLLQHRRHLLVQLSNLLHSTKPGISALCALDPQHAATTPHVVSQHTPKVLELTIDLAMQF
jgi:hypothetical protein